MTQKNLAILFQSVALLAGIFYLINKKKGFWWYILLIFIIAPLFATVGYALGKQEQVKS